MGIALPIKTCLVAILMGIDDNQKLQISPLTELNCGRAVKERPISRKASAVYNRGNDEFIQLNYQSFNSLLINFARILLIFVANHSKPILTSCHFSIKLHGYFKVYLTLALINGWPHWCPRRRHMYESVMPNGSVGGKDLLF